MENLSTTIEFKTLKALMLFAGKKDIRYYLNSLHIEQGAGGTLAVACNGHAIAIARLDYDTKAAASITIDRQYLDNLKSKYAIAINLIDETTVSIRSENGTTTVPIMDAKFPDWRRVISAKQEGNQAYFHPDYLAMVNKAGQIIQNKAIGYHIQQNGPAVGYCYLGNGVHAWVMPVVTYKDDVVSSPTFA
jgi:hypothetical protein